MTVPPLKMTLFVIYCVLFVYLFVDIVALLQSEHKKRSFRMGFVFLLAVRFFSLLSKHTRTHTSPPHQLWTGNRSIFWFICSVHTFNNVVWQKILFWTPLAIQAATFSFLLLYYSKVFLRNDWDVKKRRYQSAYVRNHFEYYVSVEKHIAIRLNTGTFEFGYFSMDVELGFRYVVGFRG